MENPILVVSIAVSSAAITALVMWLIAQRRIEVENVTAERAKWREMVRTRALKVHDAILRGNEADLRRLKNEFRALLNPFDSDDQEILDSMALDGSRKERQARTDAFAERISLLLKHDWERAKLEAGFLPCRWFLDARRRPWDLRHVENKLRWRERYSVRYRRIRIVAVVIAAVGIAACVLCHCVGPTVTKDTTKQVLLHAGMGDGENQESL